VKRQIFRRVRYHMQKRNYMDSCMFKMRHIVSMQNVIVRRNSNDSWQFRDSSE
jgi:uncharacterized protein YdeI (BOF family)